MRWLITPFLLLITLILTFSASMAQETRYLNWQPGQLRSDQYVIKTDFTASSAHKPLQDRSFDKPLLITARPGQILTVCGDQVSGYNDGGEREPDLFIQNGLSKIVLTDWQTTLTIERPFPCPGNEASHQPYHFRNVLRSDEPFMIAFGGHPEKRQKSSGLSAGKGSIPITGLPSTLPNPVNLLSGAGYGSDSDDDNFFKRPPHLPMMGKGDFSLTFLPFIRLPAQWQNHLSVWQWFHWVVGEPDAQAGVTVIIRFNQSAPVALHLTPWEYGELAENMLNTRQLLQWLAYKLSGRESFIQTLLDITALMNGQEGLDETLSAKLEEQLRIALEQPDMDFSLEFETHLLVDALSNVSLASPENGIIQLPIGRPGAKPRQLPAGQNSGQASGQKQTSDNQPGLPTNQSQRGHGEGSKPPPQPSAQIPSAREQVLDDYFAIVVNGAEFRIKKEQLPPLRRGRGNISEIQVYQPEPPGKTLALSELEEQAGIPKSSRMIAGSTPLDYLLAYGSESTKKALQDYYPVNLISEYNGHLEADVAHQGYAVADDCQICSDPLLSCNSLTHCTHDQRHIFHTSCLQHWLQQRRQDVNSGEMELQANCPYCQKEQSLELRSLLSREGMKQELHRAAKTGNLAVLVALLESGVDREATDEHGNTALHLAAQEGHSNIVLLLTEEGANFEALNRAGQRPVAVAVQSDIIDILKQAQQNPSIFFTVGHGREEALRQWLGDGNDPSQARHSDGASLLHIAAENNSPDIARQLLSTSIVNLVDKVDIHGAAPLHLAASAGNLEVAQVLLDYQAKVDATTKIGPVYNARVTPLTLAIENNHPAIVQTLLNNGADFKHVPSGFCVSNLSMDEFRPGQRSKSSDLLVDFGTISMAIELPALLKAAILGHSEVVRVLLNAGANINQKVNGFTALDLAVNNNHPEVVKVLLGARIAVNNGYQLFEAALRGHATVTRILLDYGFPYTVTQTTGRGATPLILAASKGDIDTINTLLDYGAKVDVPILNAREVIQALAALDVKTYTEAIKSAGQTALMFAAMYGHSEVVRTLLEKQADANARTILHGYTALMYAANLGNLDVVKILVEYGADLNSENSANTQAENEKKLGKTALSLAAQNGHYEIAEFLKSRGAQISKTDKQHLSKLLLAASHYGQHKFVKAALIAGADINIACGDVFNALISAAQKGHAEVVKELLNRGAPINTKNSHGVTPLGIAAYKGHNEIVKVLLERGAASEIKDNQGRTPLDLTTSQGHHEIVKILLDATNDVVDVVNYTGAALYIAVKYKHLKAVSVLLENGAPVDHIASNGYTPLLLSANRGRLEFVELLLKHNADVNYAPPKGHPPLIHAILNKHADVVKALLNAGADVAYVDNKDGASALYMAAWSGVVEVVKALLEKGAVTDQIKKAGNYTALGIAAHKGHLDVVALLIENGAAVDHTSDRGATPLLLAAEQNHPEIVELLLKHKANINSISSIGRTPLTLAAIAGNIRVINVLIAANVAVNLPDNQGYSALFTASYVGATDIVKVLLENGANVHQINTGGHTALGVAAENGHLEVISALVDNGANVDHVSDMGSTPLLLAAKQGLAETVELLGKHGADVNISYPNGRTALMIAAQTNSPGVVTVLLNNGAAADNKDADGKTALTLAKEKGHSEVVRVLERYGVVMPPAQPSTENTPLLPTSQENQPSGCTDLILVCFGGRTED